MGVLGERPREDSFPPSTPALQTPAPVSQQNGRVQYDLRPHPALRVQTEDGLQVSVTGAEHGGEPRDLFLAPASGARLLEVAMIAHFFQGAFAIDFLFQSTQRTVHGLAFF